MDISYDLRDPQIIEAIYHHLVLPTALPYNQDASPEILQSAITRLLLDTSSQLRNLMGASMYKRWESVRRSLKICQALNVGGRLEKESLVNEFKNLTQDHILILHIAQQNAALLIQKTHHQNGDNVLFEAFESSSTSDQALASIHALEWDFPGAAVSIPISEFDNPDFQEQLALFLEQASTESIKRFAACTEKAGSQAYESRDTVDPALITQMLITLLESFGHSVLPQKVKKHVRDDVCWDDGARDPWRRSPFWLVLRVSMQRYLYSMLGEKAGRINYKFFICAVLAHLLDIVSEQLTDTHADAVTYLKAKLGRRLAKLEAEANMESQALCEDHNKFFNILSPIFEISMNRANQKLEATWADFKKKYRRPMHRIPAHATEQDMKLTLPHSGRYIDRVLSTKRKGFGSHFVPITTLVDSIPKGYKRFTDRYAALVKLESNLAAISSGPKNLSEDQHDRCIGFADKIINYIDAVETAYDGNPEQKSIMILTVMELWMNMDQCATDLFPLLEEYYHGFPMEILDPLQLPYLGDMKRLKTIQNHLQSRKKASGEMSIFMDPKKGCFAERYYNGDKDMQRRHKELDEFVKQRRDEKWNEWSRLSKKFEELQTQISDMSCTMTTRATYPYDLEHNVKDCVKCRLLGQAASMRIYLYENPLPANLTLAKAVIFELNCPESFLAYRNATGKILGALAYYPDSTKENTRKEYFKELRFLVQNHPELKRFTQLKVKTTVSLGSYKKTFEQAHYSTVKFPVPFDKVFVPNGMALSYYDPTVLLWSSKYIENPSFEHHCQHQIPIIPYFQGQKFPMEGPASNEVIANQGKYSSGVKMAEYLAYYTLPGGKHRRWLQILTELACTNLNLSTESTAALITQLCWQAGPSQEGDGPLRTVHSVFLDEPFCLKLAQQIDSRLDAMPSNGSEICGLDLLITLTLRLSISPSPVIAGRVLSLLGKARDITAAWMDAFRASIQSASDVTQSTTYSKFLLWAAILCRRTFALHAINRIIICSAHLPVFIKASIFIQDNFIDQEQASALNSALKDALIRDTKMFYGMGDLLKSSFKESTQSLGSVINLLWSDSETSSRTVCSQEPLSAPLDHWVELKMKSEEDDSSETVHYNILTGNLLFNGEGAGKLPAEYGESKVLEELFDHQNIIAHKTNCFGMDYKLAFRVLDQDVYLGMRNGKLIVRTYHPRMGLLELLPRDIFISENSYDLPKPLVQDCLHWLNLKTQKLMVRPKPHIWRSRMCNWEINLKTKLATRRYSTLVDPHSELFKKVARAFDRFEYPINLVVYQPRKKRLSVDLRRMELSFFVNASHLLESKRLRAEIDPNQDIGTWEGLRSKIVLRERNNPEQRSIIVPLGPLKCKRVGFHIGADIQNLGDYGIYKVNKELGRLECAPEPRLLYTKALLHAVTSFVLPDTLTGRTGTEEALDCLQSGAAKPWRPLPDLVYVILKSIAALTPTRNYYPKHLKYMQQVTWNPDLTTWIQHSGFWPIVNGIWERSDRLAAFQLEASTPRSLQPRGDNHLLSRSSARSRLYQRSNAYSDRREPIVDLVYYPRSLRRRDQACLNVSEATSLLRSWPQKIATTSDLAGIIRRWGSVDGLDTTFVRHLLSDRLSTNLIADWGHLINTCREATEPDKYRLIFLFAHVSYQDNVDMEMIRTIIAFAVFADLKQFTPPEWPSYEEFRPHDSIPRVDSLLPLIKRCVPDLSVSENSLLPVAFSFGKQRKRAASHQKIFEAQIKNDCDELSKFLLNQWPCLEPTFNFDSVTNSGAIDLEQAKVIITPYWRRLFQNYQLSMYLTKIQPVLDLRRCEKDPCPLLEVIAARGDTNHQFVQVGTRRLNRLDRLTLLGDLFESSTIFAPQQICERPVATRDTVNVYNNISIRINGHFPHNSGIRSANNRNMRPPAVFHPDIIELRTIINERRKSKSIIRHQYGESLMQSLEALQNVRQKPVVESVPFDPGRISSDITNARGQTRFYYQRLSDAFRIGKCHGRWLQLGGLWPCTTPVALLQELRSTSKTVFGSGMRIALAEYALSIAALQRLLRLEDAHRKKDNQRLKQEWNNRGHTNWNPLSYPDWLLFEIEANLLIREDQVTVALASIFPESASNSLLQMNMGQGKTSCIIPMICLVLANKKQLMRVIVPKSLLPQTAQLLHSRLGGLLGRGIMHIPFSRKTPTTSQMIVEYYNLHLDTLKSAGIIMALPEHLMSFKLSGLQRLSDDRIEEAAHMCNVQSWLTKKSRDVMDESDYTLSARTQLIYPSGNQKTVDGHPERWLTAEALLRFVRGHLWNLQKDFPHSLEVVPRTKGGFPVTFFLRNDVQDALLARLVSDISRGHTQLLATFNPSRRERIALENFLTQDRVNEEDCEVVLHMFPDNPKAVNVVYHLRGLLVHRILLLTLKKRWNVQYGLNPKRDPIAVPFHAKGVPSEQSEFGHPDVAILFTILSFFYEGLTLSQFRQSLAAIMKSEDTSAEYEVWMQETEELPDSLRDRNMINIEDEVQIKELWGHLRYTVIVIEHYLNTFVFPAHSKQFEIKLQTSGWDLPLFSPDSLSPKRMESNGIYHPCPKNNITTGFSGTNDNRSILPLTIRQADLPALAHTNAEVLTYFLSPRNREYVVLSAGQGIRLTERQILTLINDMGIRVLIDAGAQILEHKNLDLVKMWLEIDYSSPAAIYFNEDNKAYVHYRNGKDIPLLASPFAENLGECLIYLDEAHTRGTDLKIPAHAKGALTLGLGQTKDHTVQAAMRLRNLGTTQSVVFLAPPEVHQSILDLRQKNVYDRIDSSDVIHWLLEQTCSGLEQLQPLYHTQGIDFCRRSQAEVNNPNFLGDASQRQEYLKVLRQLEQQTVSQMYDPAPKAKASSSFEASSPQIKEFVRELGCLRKGFQDTGVAVNASALQEVDQEREVYHEFEAVRESQKPFYHPPEKFEGLHRHIEYYIQTGYLEGISPAYMGFFAALSTTALGRRYGIEQNFLPSRLFISTEFLKTIVFPRSLPNDKFLRSVRWVLWNELNQTAMVVSPEEAEIIIPILRGMVKNMSNTCLVIYEAPRTRDMLQTFGNLKFYTIPALPVSWTAGAPMWLTVELGIFAGRLYFPFDEYEEVCRYLGIDMKDLKLPESRKDMSTASTGGAMDYSGEILFQESSVAEEMEIENYEAEQKLQSFTQKPLLFMQDWLANRLRGREFANTPMGFVCAKKPLTADHIFFAPVKKGGSPKPVLRTLNQQHASAEDSAELDQDYLSDDGSLDDGVVDDEIEMISGSEDNDDRGGNDDDDDDDDDKMEDKFSEHDQSTNMGND